MCHTQYRGLGKKSEPFSLDLELMDPESLKEAIQRANSDRAEADSDGSQLGPGFPSILVGPNGGGKSVSIGMIGAFTEFIDLLGPLLREVNRSDMQIGVSDGGWIWDELSRLPCVERTPSISQERLTGILDRFQWLGNAGNAGSTCSSRT